MSFFFIELFAVFIPVYQVLKQHKLRVETLAAICEWETKYNVFGSIVSDSTKIQSFSYESFKDSEKHFVRVRQPDDLSISSRKSHMYTMVALDHALRWNAEPLQKFAALRDFSGENISFLTHLAHWKRGWAERQEEQHSSRLPTNECVKDKHQIRRHFNQAIRLYAGFISSDLAQFPINISSKTLKALDEMYRKPASLLLGDSRSEYSNNSATPFLDQKRATTHDLETLPAVLSSVQDGTEAIYYWGDIPHGFASCVFDDAEEAIKYLVLTNTWPKFVNEGFPEQIRDSRGRSLSRELHQLFFWPREST